MAEVDRGRLGERRLRDSASPVAPISVSRYSRRSRKTLPRGLEMSSSPTVQTLERRRSGRARAPLRRCARRSGRGSSVVMLRRHHPDLAGDGLAAGGAVRPTADDGREQSGTSAGVHAAVSRPGGTSAAWRPAIDSGTPSAMPPAPRTISAPGSCRRASSSSSRRGRDPSPLRRTPGRVRGRRRGWRRSRAAASGGARCAGPTASDEARLSGVAGLLVDDAARAFAGEDRDGVDAGRRRPGCRRARPTASPPRPRRSRTRPCRGCRARPGRSRPDGRRRRCARRAAAPGRSWSWPGCPGRARSRRSSCRCARVMGPLHTITGPTGIVVASTPCMLNSSLQAASTAASTTGRYSGRQPAITALIGDLLDRDLYEVRRHRRPRSRRATGSCPSSIRSTRSSVGGTTGRPSVQPAIEHRFDLVFELGDLDPAAVQDDAAEAHPQLVDEVGVDATSSRIPAGTPGGPRRGRSTPVSASHCVPAPADGAFGLDPAVDRMSVGTVSMSWCQRHARSASWIGARAAGERRVVLGVHRQRRRPPPARAAPVPPSGTSRTPPSRRRPDRQAVEVGCSRSPSRASSRSPSAHRTSSQILPPPYGIASGSAAVS